jgi:hypothetical protein
MPDATSIGCQVHLPLHSTCAQLQACTYSELPHNILGIRALVPGLTQGDHHTITLHPRPDRCKKEIESKFFHLICQTADERLQVVLPVDGHDPVAHLPITDREVSVPSFASLFLAEAGKQGQVPRCSQ